MAQCLTPFTKKSKIGNQTDEFPCGKCPNCVARRTSGWSFRLMQQEKVSFNAHFITLTYDTKHVPISDHGFMQLKKRDVQLFFKRLRKLDVATSPDGKSNIKYYVVGEYGGKTKRPHYHVIIFNVKIEHIPVAWGLGDVHYGTVTGASIGYTLKYISKPNKIPEFARDDRQPQFALMSKGLGKNYLTPNIMAWHNETKANAFLTRMYVNLEDGKKASMPRYYKDKIYNEGVRKSIAHVSKINAEYEQRKKEHEYRGEYWKDYYNSIMSAFKKMERDYLKNQKL